MTILNAFKDRIRGNDFAPSRVFTPPALPLNYSNIVMKMFSHKYSTYFFEPEEGEIAEQQKEIESCQGKRHESRVKIFTDNIINGEEYYKEVAKKNDPPDLGVIWEIVDNDH